MEKFDKTKIGYLILGIVLIGLFLFFSYARIFDEFEYSILDLRYKLRMPEPVDKNIAIIEVGDDSIENIGKWPFPRKYHTLLIKALKNAGAETIIFDIFFSESKEGDDEFAKAAIEAGNVYIPYVFEIDRESKDKSRVHASGYAADLIEVLKKAAKGSGYVNVEPDMDGKIRRIPPFIEYENKKYPHLTVLAALNKLGYNFDDVKIYPRKKIVAGKNLVIPLGDDSSLLVDYPGVWGKDFRHYSYIDVLQSYLSDLTGQEPRINLEEFAGSVCFIGLTATASPDAHPSPLEPIYPGVGVHTSVYNSIMNNTFLKRATRSTNLIILVFLWLLTSFITERISKKYSIMAILGIMASFFGVAIILFWIFRIWIDVFYPMVTMASVYVIFTFKKYISEMQKRELIEKELNIAKNIQQSFLPKIVPNLGGLDIYVEMLTARQVGGDLYDILDLDDGKIGFMMGDVSGKGVPAALYMAQVVSEFKTHVRSGNPREVLHNLNTRLVEECGSGLFVTLTYMVIDTKTKTASFSIGGHMPTVLVTPGGEVKLLDVNVGMPLGMIESEFEVVEYKYEPGSIFILYTDGVTEAMNIKEEMFEQERLTALSKTLANKSSEEVVKRIHEAVTEFAGKAKQHDDITVMAIKV